MSSFKLFIFFIISTVVSMLLLLYAQSSFFTTLVFLPMVFSLYPLAILLHRMVSRYDVYFFLDRIGDLHCHLDAPFIISDESKFWTWRNRGFSNSGSRDDEFFRVNSSIIKVTFPRFFRHPEAKILRQDPSVLSDEYFNLAWVDVKSWDVGLDTEHRNDIRVPIHMALRVIKAGSNQRSFLHQIINYGEHFQMWSREKEAFDRCEAEFLRAEADLKSKLRNTETDMRYLRDGISRIISELRDSKSANRSKVGAEAREALEKLLAEIDAPVNSVDAPSGK